MASMNQHHFAGGKYRHSYDDLEGLDYDDYENNYDDDIVDEPDAWPGYGTMGRVKSRKQAMKFARRHR